MLPTALVYSSHNRSHVLHHDLIVQRALSGKDNHRILLLPMSMAPHHGDERALQKEEANSFGWYFRQFEQHGLEVVPFFWTQGLRQQDVELLFNYLETSEVVLLAGGSSLVGLDRYKDLGARFFGDPDKFKRALHARQARGQLTVGFSAGADQLMDNLFRITQGQSDRAHAFGVISETLITLHHDPSRNPQLESAARQFPRARVFGLPNDSGLAVRSGTAPSGAHWQLTGFVVDSSWDRPEDAWHVRTRAGANIEHFYADGRHWGFRHGDWMLRVKSADGSKDQSWIRSGDRVLVYKTQQPVGMSTPEDLIAQA